MRKNILYIVSRLSNKGPTNQLYGIISNLDKKKYNPIILTLSAELTESKINDFKRLDVDIYSINRQRYTPNFILKRKIKKYIEKFNPEIIQTQGIRADSLISSMNYKENHTLTLRNYAKVDYTEKFGRILGRYMSWKTYRNIKQCNYVVTCSNTLQNMYIRDTSKEILSIQNGVDTHKYQIVADVEERNLIRKKLGLNIDSKIFLVVGSFIKRKDPLTIVKAFNNVKNQNFELVFLGSGPLLKESKVSSQNTNIKFLGNVTNVEEYYKSADVYISASISEGLPNSVLEAGASGLDIILSNIPQHKEIFQNTKYKPCYFEIGDINKLNDIINKNFRNKISNNNLNKEIEENFSVENMSNQYQKLYQQIIKSNSGR